MKKIDVVIAWVDGNEPKHIAKRMAVMNGGKEQELEDIAGLTRFSSQGEIYFCLGSILRFAPFVNTIYIVTDNQTPNTQDFLNKNFPDNKIPIKIIDHTEIFAGYDKYLPTFNSLSIETMLYRIPNLSENFVYFNDDFMLLAPIKPTDWFEDDKLICYGAKFKCCLARIIRALKPKKNGHKTFGYKDAMLNAADLLKKSFFRYFPHAPIPLKKSCYFDFYAKHPEAIEHNIKHKFREPSQFNPQQLGILLEETMNKCVFKSNKNKVLFLKPTQKNEGYLARRLSSADKNDQLMFGCISSFDKATDADKELFNNWIKNRLALK